MEEAPEPQAKVAALAVDGAIGDHEPYQHAKGKAVAQCSVPRHCAGVFKLTQSPLCLEPYALQLTTRVDAIRES